MCIPNMPERPSDFILYVAFRSELNRGCEESPEDGLSVIIQLMVGRKVPRGFRLVLESSSIRHLDTMTVLRLVVAILVVNLCTPCLLV